MRVPFLFVLITLINFLSTYSFAQEVNVRTVIVLQDEFHQINLDKKLHQIAEKNNVKSVVDLNTYQNSYFPNLSTSEVFSNIRQNNNRNILVLVTSSQQICDVNIFYPTNEVTLNEELKNYFNSLGCIFTEHYQANEFYSTQYNIQQNANAEVPVVFFQTAERRIEKLDTIVNVALNRSGEDLTEATEVVVFSYPLTAEENVDFVPFSKVVRFEAGETRVMFDFQIFESDDTADEFGIGLRYPVNAVISDDPSKSNSLLVKLYSDTAKDTFTISAPQLDFYNEGEDYKLTLTRNNPNQFQAVEYEVELVGIGTEFTSSQTNFVFTSGVQSIDLTFKVNDDFKFNAEQRFVNFNFKPTAKALFPNGSSISFPIGDNRKSERGSFGFEYSKYIVKNESKLPDVKVIRKNSTNSFGKFNLEIKDEGSSFSANQLIDFKEGQSAAAVDLTELPNSNADLQFKLIPLVDLDVFQSTTNVKVVDPNSTTSGLDSLEFQTQNNSVVEGTASYTIQLDRKGSLDYEAKVSISVSGGTAIEGVDFKLKQTEFTFGLNETSKTLELEILNDDVFTGDRVISLLVTSDGLNLTTNVLQVALLENDLDKLGTISFDKNDLKVEEEQLNVPVVVKRDIAGPAVEVTMLVVDGKAKAGVDFEWSGPRVLRFDDGQTEVVTYLNMIGDTIPDFDKDFSLKLTSTKELSFGSAQMNITINDNEKNNAIFVKPTGENIVVEQGQITSISTMSEDKLLKLTLTRTVNTSEVFRLNIKAQEGTAKSGIHFKDFDETVLFGAGETTKTINLTLYKATVTGSSNDFTLNLSADTKNFIVENPALQIKITPNVEIVPPGGESSGGSFSLIWLFGLSFLGLARRMSRSVNSV